MHIGRVYNWLALAGAVVLLLFACSCTTGRPTFTLPDAYTQCLTTVKNERFAVSWVRTDLTVPALQIALAHEAVHRQQMNGFETCEAFNAWRSQGQNNARLEAVAYCASAATGVSIGYWLDVPTAIEQVTKTLRDNYDLKGGDADELMKQACQYTPGG